MNNIAASILTAVIGAGLSVVTAAPAHAARTVCDFAFTHPPYVQHTNGSAILVGGFAECNPAPSQFRVLVRLQHLENGTWETKAVNDDGQIPRRRVNIATYVPFCTPGGWRGSATIWFTHDGRDYDLTRESTAVIVNCD